MSVVLKAKKDILYAYVVCGGHDSCGFVTIVPISPSVLILFLLQVESV